MDHATLSQETCAEQCAIRSTSQSGRLYSHRNQWIPPNCRPPPLPPSVMVVKNEERLLYLALYRDKVAQHQAQLEQADEAAKGGRSDRRHLGGDCGHHGPAAVSGNNTSAFGAFGIGGSVASDAEVSMAMRRPTSHMESRADSDIGLRATRKSQVGDVAENNVAGHSAQAGSRCSVLPTLDGRAQSSSTGASSHIATVSNRAAFGGVTSDHLVARQLGKLFDEWRASQDENESEMQATPSAGGRFLIGRQDASCAAPKTPRVPATPSGRADGFQRLLRSGTRAEVLGGDRIEIAASPAPEIEIEEGASQSSGGRSCLRELLPERTFGTEVDRSKSDRLFNVITNSKVRVESFADRGHSDLASRQVPVEIEGFSHLKLLRLYQGPWRMTV